MITMLDSYYTVLIIIYKEEKIMKPSEMNAKELEALIRQKVEKDNKDAIIALRSRQKEEVDSLKALLTKKKRQEYSNTVNEVGKYLVGKFDKDGRHNSDMTVDDYKNWLDEMIVFVREHSRDSQHQQS